MSDEAKPGVRVLALQAASLAMTALRGEAALIDEPEPAAPSRDYLEQLAEAMFPTRREAGGVVKPAPTSRALRRKRKGR